MLHVIAISDKGFNDINPSTAGHDTCSPTSGFGPSIRPYYLIHYVASGKGSFECSKGIFHLHQGQLFIIRPGEVTKYWANPDDPWHIIFVSFDGELADKLLDNDVIVADFSENIFFEILECEQMVSMREEFLASTIFKILAVLFETGKKNTDYALEAKNYILKNYMGRISVQKIADNLHINRRYLGCLFKKEMNMTLKGFLTMTRMSRAVSLLKMGHSVAAVAIMVGYRDPFNFSKMFKKHFGRSPETFKENVLLLPAYPPLSRVE